jgi:hypothetical protein
MLATATQHNARLLIIVMQFGALLGLKIKNQKYEFGSCIGSRKTMSPTRPCGLSGIGSVSCAKP